MGKFSGYFQSVFEQSEQPNNYQEFDAPREPVPSQAAPAEEQSASRSVLKDAAGLWGMGTGSLVQGAGWLFNSDELQKLGRDTADYWERTLSDTQRDANQKRFVNEDWSIGDAATDWNSYFGAVVQSLPHMVPGVGAAGAAGRGALALGLSNKVAAGAAMAGGSIGEGVTIGAMVGQEVDEAIRGMSEEDKLQSPYYADLRKLYGEEESTSRLSTMAANPAALKAGTVGAALGLAFNKFLGDALTQRLSGGPLREGAKGMALESGTEVLQSGYEAHTRQSALNEYASQPMNYTDIVNEMVTGLAAGAVMGGGVGVLGGLQGKPEEGEPGTVPPTPVPQPDTTDRVIEARQSAEASGADPLESAVAGSRALLDDFITRPTETAFDQADDIGGLLSQAQQMQGLDPAGQDLSAPATALPDTPMPETGLAPQAAPRPLSEKVGSAQPQDAPEVVYQQDGVTVRKFGERLGFEATAQGFEGSAWAPTMSEARRSLAQLVEKNKPTEAVLQNRDRSRPAYVEQMQAIANEPDYDRVSVSRDPNTGAPMVFQRQSEQAPDAEAPVIWDADKGNTDTVTMSDGKGGTRKVPVQYAVVEADTVTASNKADGTANEGYGQGGLTALNNGRTAGLQAAFEKGKAQGYIDAMLADTAHGVPAEAIRAKKSPMLIRLFDEAALKGIDDPGAASNVSANAELSAIEQAQTDARKLDNDLLNEILPGDVTGTANANFVRRFTELLSKDGAGNSLRDAKGLLTAAGQKRIKGALVERAYRDETLTQELTEAVDNDLKTLGDALAEVAGRWALMRERAKEGSINPDMDITDALVSAVNMIRKSRQEGVALADLAGQVDAFAGPADQMAVEILHLFYHGKNFGRIRAKDVIASTLLGYVDSALVAVPGPDIFGETTTPQSVLEVQRGQIEGTQDSRRVQPDGSDDREVGTAGEGSVSGAGREADAEQGAETGSTQEVEAAAAQTEASPSVDFDLQPQTETELAEQTRTRQEAADTEARQKREAEQREQADAEADDFVLSGSDSRIDQAEARGQDNLFDAPVKAEPKPDQQDKPAIGARDKNGYLRVNGKFITPHSDYGFVVRTKSGGVFRPDRTMYGFKTEQEAAEFAKSLPEDLQGGVYDPESKPAQQPEPTVSQDAAEVEPATPAEQVEQAAAEVEQNPSEAQIEAGNYKKGHVTVQGLDITLENPRGSTRSGTDPDGNDWSVTMAHHYGYLKRTEGADGEHVDVFVGQDLDSDSVFVVDQVNADGTFDEHKVLLGFKNQLQARTGYKDNYSSGWKVGPITRMTMDEFKAWLAEGDLTKPLKLEVAPAESGITWKKDGKRVWRADDGQIITDESFTAGGVRTNFFPVYASKADRDAGNNYASGESLTEAKGKAVARQQVEPENVELTDQIDSAESLREDGADYESIQDVRNEWSDAGIQHSISERNGIITVDKIIVPEGIRGEGRGTEAMRLLMDYADQTGRVIALSPSTDFGGRKLQLKRFYGRLGFVENKGQNRDFEISESMLRVPQSLDGAPLPAQDGVDARRSSYRANPDQRDLFTNMSELEALQNEDPYDGAETRPGTTEDQRDAGRSALRDFFRQLNARYKRSGRIPEEGTGVSLLGAAIYKNFKEGKPNQLIGQTVRTPQDLAALAQVYRDPRFETFRLVLTKNGNVVSEQAVTSRLPSTVRFHDSYLDDLRDAMETTGADGYYMMHNHPSGKSQPSQADLVATQRTAREVPGFLSHVVIDFNEFSTIDADAKIETTKDDSLGSTDFWSDPDQPNDLLGFKISNGRHVAELAKKLQNDQDRIVFIGANAKNEVTLLTSLPASLMMDLSGKQKNRAEAIATLRRLKRTSGSGGYAFLVVNDKIDVRTFAPLINDGVVMDVVDPDGNSGHTVGDPKRYPGDVIEANIRGMRVAETSDYSPATGARFSRKRNVRDIDQFTDLTDVQRKAFGKISPLTPTESAKEWFAERTNRWQTKLRQGIVDRFAALMEMDEAVHGRDVIENSTASSSWVLAQMAGAASGALQSMLTTSRIQLDSREKVIKLRQDSDRGLNDVLKELGGPGEIDRFFGWIAGNRSRKLLEEGRENLFEPDEVEALATANNGTTATGESRAELYDRVFAEFQKFRDDVLEIADSTGLLRKGMDEEQAMLFLADKYEVNPALAQKYKKAMRAANTADDVEVREMALERAGEAWGQLTEEIQMEVDNFDQEYDTLTTDQRDLWANEFYVPFYREAERQHQTTGPLPSNGLSRQKAYERLKGGTGNLRDLLENTMMNFHHLLQASLKNQAAIQAMDNAQALGIAEMTTESNRDKDNSTFILKDGEKVWYNIDDPLVYKAVTALAHPGMNSTAMKTMRGFKRLFTNLTTTTPQFVIANLLRDSMQASATSEVSKNMLKNMAQGSKAYGNARIRAAMMASGGAFSFGHLYGDNIDEVKLQLTGGLARAEILRSPSMIPGAISGVWRHWNEVTNFTENINRAAIYESNKSEKGELYAAFKSRDLMNFSQHGAWPAIRILIDVVPFLNARLQGLDKIYRSGVKPGVKMAFGQGSATDKQSMARFWTVTGALALASMALFLKNREDEDFQRLEEWQKDTYWYIRTGKDSAMFIPKPFEVGAIATLVERLTEQAVSDTATGGLFAERLSHMLMDTFSFSPVPQMFQPALDVYANYDAFTDRPIESMGMERLSPSLRARGNTTSLAKGMSRVTEAISGPDGKLTLSPVQIDHMINGYFGSVGSWIAGVGDTIWKTANGEVAPDKHWYEYQPVRRFYKNLGDEDKYTRYGTVFYEALKETNRVYADIRQYQAIGDTETAMQVLQDNRQTLAMRKALSRVQRQLSAINQQMQKVYRMPGDSEYKRRELDRLRAMRNRIQETVGRRLEELKASAS